MKTHTPQTTLKNARVLRRFGIWTFESFTHPNGSAQYVLCNGTFCNYVIFYGFNGKWAAESVVYRQDIISYLNKRAAKEIDEIS